MEIPADWMRLLWIDPGWQRLAMTFWAVPPDASCIHLYREFTSEVGSAAVAAEAALVEARAYKFELFGIDKKASEQHSMSHGETHLQAYTKEFASRKLVSRLTSSGFVLGSPNVESRTESLKHWLRLRPDGYPTLRVHKCCQTFIWQMQRQYFKDNRPDKREGKDDDLVDTAEYCAAYFDHWVGRTASGLYYHAPEEHEKHEKGTDAGRWWLKLMGDDGGERRGIPLGPRTTTFRTRGPGLH